MPYYLVPADPPYDIHSTDDAAHEWRRTLPAFNVRNDAYCAQASANAPTEIVFYAWADEIDAWHRRESERLHTGHYQPVPWYRYTTLTEATRYHYAHRSRNRDGMIAYTPSDEYGVQDRQLRVRPGRYLAEFYPTIAQAQRDQWAHDCDPKMENLQFATSAEDIVSVYQHGPGSCMDGRHFPVDRYNHDGSDGCQIHPCAVYGDSDLALAYLGTVDRAIARCIVWPERRRYSRLYGETNLLAERLHEAGYTPGSMIGARIRRIDRARDHVIVPYLDGAEAAVVYDSQYLQLVDVGDLDDDDQYCDGSYQCGYATFRTLEPEQVACDHCHALYDPEQSDYGSEYCESCGNDRMLCDRCDTGGWNFEVIDDHYLCDDCVCDHVSTCQDADCERRWEEDRAFTPDERRERQRRHVADLCSECAGHYCYCDTCDDAYDTRETVACPTCGRYPRCTHTGDLLGPLTVPARPRMEDADVSPF